MAPTYFLPPDFLSYPAPQEGNPGPIQLGQFISSHKDPGHTVASLAPLDLEEYGIKTHTVSGTAMAHKYSTSATEHASLFLKSVELVGAKLGFSFQDTDFNNLLSEIEQFEAQSIIVKDETYVKDSMGKPEIQGWIKGVFFKKSVYIVDGILIAKPKSDKTKISTSAEATSGASGALEVPVGPPAHAPAFGGVFQHKTSRKYGLSFVPSTCDGTRARTRSSATWAK
ncbi:hypothetical protein EDB80DRAFT_736930 [Ilyonectria destructans]|nr:hypothetical protein EDB80DRAFT_736930 [Ilyonectria destructans]